MFWLKVAGKVLEFVGMGALLLATRWLLTPASYQDDVRETRHVVRLLRWDMLSLSNWLDLLPYRFAVVASHELGIAQHRLAALRKRYERGEFREDTQVHGSNQPANEQPNHPTDQDSDANRLDSGQ